MKTMKKITLLILGMLGMVLISCQDLTEGFNDNPNAFTEVPSDLIIGQVELQAEMIANSTAARTAGIFVDHFTGADRQYVALNNYTTTAGDYDDLWERIYNLRAQALIIQENSTNLVIKGRAQMLEALAIGEAAALWGDIPFTEANKPTEFENPKYDSQAEVFKAVQALLDQALTNVGNSVVQGSVMVINGASYAKIIHSLKARYYLIVKDYANALKEAQLGINLVNGDQGLLVKHSATNNTENLFWQFGIEQRAGYMTVVNSHWRKLLQGETPRALATPGSANIASILIDADELNYGNAKSLFAVNAPGILIDGIENAFIAIEASHRLGQESTARDLYNLLRQALTVRFGGEFPATSSTGTQLLKEILEEKYLLMPGSMQIFHDIRRTKNLIGVPIKNSSVSKIPQRFLYPQTEKNANKNFPGFVDLYEETPNNK
jgi:hypothetical protein